MSRRTPHARPAYILMTVIVAFFIVLAFVTITQALVLLEWNRDRASDLDEVATQAMASARTWSRARVNELSPGREVTLPLDDVLPPDTTGTARLRCTKTDSGALRVECDITVARAGRERVRRALWPLP